MTIDFQAEVGDVIQTAGKTNWLVLEKVPPTEDTQQLYVMSLASGYKAHFYVKQNKHSGYFYIPEGFSVNLLNEAE